ncbi:MAG TPA: AAA family ATPase [Micromonosporaceae bacterium]|nr:AAA family ATPase [Micromonosporaceae bacterium]
MIEEESAVLVGRHAHLELLDQALDRVRNGQLAVVEISGESGIGKTRILGELAQRARAAGFMVCAGSGTQIEQSVPFGVYVEALQPMAPPTIDEQDDRAVALRMLRDRDSARLPGAPTSVDLFDLHAGLRRLLSDRVALCLDDLHWADPASLELTEYLLRKPPQGPALIAVAFRNVQPHSGIIDAVARLGAASFRITLPPLAPAELEALLPDQSPHRRALILQASRGNPRHVEVLTRLGDDALAVLADDLDMPEYDLADSPARHLLAGLATEITALVPAAQRVAHAAAVVSEPADINLVAHVAQLSVKAVVEAVDQMHRLGLVRVDGACLRFRHPLLRVTAYWLAGPAWRIGAHARAASYLEQHGGALNVRADHTARSARQGDEAAVRLLIEASRAGFYRVPAKAARWLEAALRIIPDTNPWPTRRPALVLRYLHALALSGQPPTNRNALRELLHRDRPLPTQAVAVGAALARLRGDLDEAAALLGNQVISQGQQPVTEAARRIELAAVAVLDADPADALDHAQRALGLLGTGRPELTAAAQVLQAWAALDSGHPAAAVEYIERAAAMADAASDTALRPRVEMLCALAWVELRLGRMAAAARHLARTRHLIGQINQSGALPYLLIVQGALHCRRGNLAKALESLDGATAVAHRLGNLELVAMADTVRLRPQLWLAGPAAAITAGRRLTEARRPRSGLALRMAKLEIAVAHAVAKEAVCLDLAAALRPKSADPLALITNNAIQAMMAARTGDLAVARERADQADAVATGAGLPYERGLASYVKGYVAARANCLREATALVRDAITWFTSAGAAVEVARAHHLMAQLHRRAGRHEQSRAEFAHAKSGYLACGANWLLTTLPKMGVRSVPRLRETTMADKLTVREEEIAQLVTVGLSNQEIASRLFLSRRTVESHVSRIFAKLDVRSRVHLAHRLKSPAAPRHDSPAPERLVTVGSDFKGQLPET